MKFKLAHSLSLLFSLFLGCCLPLQAQQAAPAAEAGFDNASRQALRDLAAQVRESLKADPRIPRQATVCLMPLANDRQGYLGDLLKTAVTDAGLTYVEARNDPFWPALLKEMEMNQRQNDIFDPATLSSFGKLKAAQLLLYGDIRGIQSAGSQASAEATLHLSSVETKQHLWGDSFTGMYPLPDLAGGLVWGEHELKLIDACQAELAKAWGQLPELRGLKVGYFTLSGDRDRTVTQKIAETLQKAGAVPVQIEATSQAEARRLLAAKPGTCDAILSGAFRGPDKEMVKEGVSDKEWQMRAILQLRLEKPGAVQLWSQSFLQSVTWMEPNSKETSGLQAKKAAEGHPWLIAGILAALVLFLFIWRAGVPR